MKITAKAFLLFSLAPFLAACATDNAPPVPGMARIVFVRGVDYGQISDKANITLDNNNATRLSLPPNAYAWIDVPVGDHSVSYENFVPRDQTCNEARVAPTAVVQPVRLDTQQIKYIRIDYAAEAKFACPNGGGTVTAVPQHWSDIGANEAKAIMATASYTHWHAASDFGSVNP